MSLFVLASRADWLFHVESRVTANLPACFRTDLIQTSSSMPSSSIGTLARSSSSSNSNCSPSLSCSTSTFDSVVVSVAATGFGPTLAELDLPLERFFIRRRSSSEGKVKQLFRSPWYRKPWTDVGAPPCPFRYTVQSMKAPESMKLMTRPFIRVPVLSSLSMTIWSGLDVDTFRRLCTPFSTFGLTYRRLSAYCRLAERSTDDCRRFVSITKARTTWPGMTSATDSRGTRKYATTCSASSSS
mmetsp:Transcript_22135/g.64255  ORF Transcript_22135/g.64255 Transcript_22135/m.64255 type:complete len:242 (-) Transcript_22135:357-1082(-)